MKDNDFSLPNLDSPSPRWLAFRRVLLFAAIFAAGIAVGAIGAARYIRHQILTTLAHPETITDRIVPVLRHRLRLSDDQTRQVAEIFARRFAATESLRAEFTPRLESELIQLHNEIAEVLTPEQRTRWKLLRDRLIPTAPAPRNNELSYPASAPPIPR